MPDTYKLLFDTNFFIRFFTADEPVQQQACVQVIDQIQQGKIRPYLSNIVLLETGYILKKIYQVSPPQLQAIQKAMLSLRNVTIVETTHSSTALNWHWDTHVKLADCLIASQLKPGMVLCTYDQEFKKLPNILCQTPAEVVSLIEP